VSARAELARIFNSRVKSEVRDRAAAVLIRRDGAAPISRLVEKLEVDTRITTEGAFEGVRVAEIWRDRAADLWHALAVVNRAELREATAASMQEAGRRVGSDLARADAALTRLGEVRALIDARRSSRERDALVARARVAGAPRDDFRPTTAEVEQRLDAVLWSTRFQVRALEVDPSTGREGSRLPRLRGAFEERITQIGFRIAGDGERVDLVLTSRMLLEEVPRNFDGHFVRWEGSYELMGGPAESSVVVLSSQGSGGESYSTASVARARALATGAQELASDLQKQISRYLQERDDH
jgi:hypothetical protein